LRGEALSGRVVVELGAGVFEKNPWRVRCPPLDPVLFNVDGVGVDDVEFLAMIPAPPDASTLWTLLTQ
jgi:hypothetical protein